LRTVLFRPQAEADLLSIALYVSDSSPERALALVSRLRRRCDILRAHPFAGRPRPELGTDLRSLVERPYVILYRLVAEEIEIVAILHGALDLPAAMTKRMERED